MLECHKLISKYAQRDNETTHKTEQQDQHALWIFLRKCGGAVHDDIPFCLEN